METNGDQTQHLETKPPLVRLTYTYSPVNVNDILGALFLGILSVVLLIGWIRAEARNHSLIAKLSQ